MKPLKTNLILATLFILLSVVDAIEVREPDQEKDPSPGSDAATAAEPDDNGMAVGEAPSVHLSATTDAPAVDEFISNIPTATTTVVDAVFPDNHKNFTASTYLGTIESPPFHNIYQKPYKEYYAQKDQYMSSKPIKFEQNNGVNRFVANGLGSYRDEVQSGSELQQRSKPYPYVFVGQHNTESEEASHNLDATESNTENEGSDQGGSSLSSFGSAFGFPQGLPFSGIFGSQTPNLHPTSTQGHRSEVTKHSNTGSWKKVFRLLSTVLPFGLLLATLTPNILYINTTDESRPSRLRSLGEDGMFSDQTDKASDPLVELVQRFGGLEAMDDPVCEDRLFCEMSLLGQQSNSNLVEKGFWYLANETPDDIAQEVGMKDLFKAIRTKSCTIYDCQPQQQIVKETKEVQQKEHKKLKPKKVKKFIRS